MLAPEGWTLAVFDDGSGPALYVAGSFTAAGGMPASNIARWDGASWSTLAEGVDGSVQALAVFDDGSGNGPGLYAGGEFTAAGGLVARRVARWDGSHWSPVGTGMQGAAPGPFVKAMFVHDDGRGGGPALYAGGWFDSAGGVPARNIARWNGSTWSPVGSGLERYPHVLSAFDDGAGPVLVAGGSFLEAGGLTANHVARWDGESWSPLDSGTSGTVSALGVLGDGADAALFAAGGFGTASGVGVNGIARWDGAHWQPLGSGLHEAVTSLAVFGDGERGLPALHVGGVFASAGPLDADGIAWWRNGWRDLSGGLKRGDEAGSAWGMAEFDDDGDGRPALFVGGYFASAGGVPADSIARWDGLEWSALGSGVDRIVWTLLPFDDGSGPALYAGGTFNHAGGVRVHQIARWDGSSWSEPGGGLFGSVNALAVFDGGDGPELIAGGRFVRGGVDGVTLSRIARWDGSTWSELAGGMPGGTSEVFALLVHDDGGGPMLYAGGRFPGAGGVTAPNLARWDGSNWSSIGGTDFAVVALARFDDGSRRSSLVAAGQFTSVEGLAVQRIARWDGASWSALGGGLSGPVQVLATFDDGGGPALYVGGDFATAFDSGDSFLARWQGCPDLEPPVLACPAGISLPDPGSPGEVVEFSVTATDARDPFPLVQCWPPSGSLFPRGTTMVRCKARDAAGNESECVFPVKIGDRAVAR